MIQIIALQQLLSLSQSSQPQPLLFEPHPNIEPLLPQPPQKNKRMMIHQIPLLPLLPKPHPLLHLSLHLSLQPQFDKSPIKASIDFEYSISYGGGMAMFPERN